MVNVTITKQKKIPQRRFSFLFFLLLLASWSGSDWICLKEKSASREKWFKDKLTWTNRGGQSWVWIWSVPRTCVFGVHKSQRATIYHTAAYRVCPLAANVKIYMQVGALTWWVPRFARRWRAATQKQPCINCPNNMENRNSAALSTRSAAFAVVFGIKVTSRVIKAAMTTARSASLTWSDSAASCYNCIPSKREDKTSRSPPEGWLKSSSWAPSVLANGPYAELKTQINFSRGWVLSFQVVLIALMNV